jgi:formylglycine-generating enzyme required for sulfatase activity
MDVEQPHSFEFETVTVDRRGEITARQKLVAQEYEQALGRGVVLSMVQIPAGVFWMGSRPGQGYEDEHPAHMRRVVGFLMGKYPVTQAQFQAVMGWLPPCRQRSEKKPVDRVSWNEAQTFCRKLSKLSGRRYRLPCEAEWEYACRAGSITPFHYGETLTTNLANYVGEYIFREEPQGVYRHGSTEVGSFPPNAFGLYDMHGNVWEWCADGWHDDYRGASPIAGVWEAVGSNEHVLRGGSWHETPNHCRSAARLKQDAAQGEDYFGFRVALSELTLFTAPRPEDKSLLRRGMEWLRRQV